MCAVWHTHRCFAMCLPQRCPDRLPRGTATTSTWHSIRLRVCCPVIPMVARSRYSAGRRCSRPGVVVTVAAGLPMPRRTCMFQEGSVPRCCQCGLAQHPSLPCSVGNCRITRDFREAPVDDGLVGTAPRFRPHRKIRILPARRHPAAVFPVLMVNREQNYSHVCSDLDPHCCRLF